MILSKFISILSFTHQNGNWAKSYLISISTHLILFDKLKLTQSSASATEHSLLIHTQHCSSPIETTWNSGILLLDVPLFHTFKKLEHLQNVSSSFMSFNACINIRNVGRLIVVGLLSCRFAQANIFPESEQSIIIGLFERVFLVRM